MDADATLEGILIRQAEHQALLRALCATHPNKKMLLAALDHESLLHESLALGSTLSDHHRERVNVGIAVWRKNLEEAAKDEG
jgi:hypothetical protein